MRRTSPSRAESAYERFRLLRVERYVADPARAIAHGCSRNSHVVKVLSYMALLRAEGRAGPPLAVQPSVACTAAVRQFFSASDGDQAAHLLPGQIRIDGQFPWLYLQGAAARQLENEFAYVEPMHANFNKADSAAEANGMADAFADACRHVLVAPGPPEREIAHAYHQVWTPAALQALFAAEAQKRSNPLPPDLSYGEPGTAEYGMILNLEERGEAMSDEATWNNFEQISVLDYYRASFDDPPPELQPRAIAEFLREMSG